jgi:hypothetical protein
MISVIHAPTDEKVKACDYPFPAGGRRMEMDWDCVAAAFQSAIDRLGWDADLEVRPERQYVMVRFSSGCAHSVARTMDEFYDDVEESIGTDAFMSIWIDFSFKP